MTAMFSKDAEGNDSSTAETIIGRSVKIEGNFNGDDNIIVEGEVKGSLKTNKNLDVKEGAKITANAEAANMTIAGEIHGNVQCHENLEITSSGKIFGDIITKVISVASGAIIKGKITAEGTEIKTRKIEKDVS